MSNKSIPKSIFFFPNGMAAVCDNHGQQMPRYQSGRHGDTVRALEMDGYDWRKLPDRNGFPSGERKYTDKELMEQMEESK